MKRQSRKLFALTLLTALVAVVAAAPAMAEDPTSGYLADFLSDFDRANGQITDLAEAVPADKYGWGPSEGVRTMSQVYMHIAGGNYFLTGFLGGTPPEGVDPSKLEEITDKAEVLKALQQSIEHTRALVAGMTEEQLNEKVQLGPNEVTKRRVLMIVAGHAHEHLGQAIAYARSMGVVPPWSS